MYPSMLSIREIARKKDEEHNVAYAMLQIQLQRTTPLSHLSNSNRWFVRSFCIPRYRESISSPFYEAEITSLRHCYPHGR